MKALGFLFLGALLGSPGCDHGASTPENTLPVVVNAGPPGAEYVNGLFTSITICVPGTTNCQVLDSVLVDTGSMGLRVLSSAAGGTFSLTLPQENDPDGNPIAECGGFVDGFTWGPLRLADVKMGNEDARSVPIQVIGDPSFSSVPTSCSSTGGASEDTLATLNAYAILGVGPFPQDCGSPCDAPFTAGDTGNPGFYYTCPSSGCQPAEVAVEAQAQNPVSRLPIDNNGVIVDLPSVSAGGAASVNGTLVFGIGTQPNNDLGGATVLPIDPVTLTFTTEYQGTPYALSFIDSGSNAIYFLNSNLSGVATCVDTETNTQASSFYCPPATVSLMATNLGINGASSAVTFGVADTDTLLTQNNFAYDNLAGISGTTSDSEYFDWGLPFFFGRRVFFAIEGSVAPAPYFAY
jgi:hypothetical protein